MQRNKHGIESSKSQQEYQNYLSKNSGLFQSLKFSKPIIDVSQSSLFNLGSTTLPNLKINPLMLSLLVLSMVSSVDGQKDQSQFKTDIDLKDDANSHPLQNPVPIPQIKEIFFGGEIADSKKIMHEGRLHVVKAHGGEVAEVHDKILRDLGLVISVVTNLKKVRVKIEPSSAYNGIKSESITNVIGQARELMEVQKIDKIERENFIKENYKKFVGASMLGVGISDLTQNPNNLVKFDGKITAIDVDATNFPIIPFYIFDRFGIDRNIILESAKEFYQSPQYESLKQLKLDSVLKVCGEDSDFYKIYLENFKKMEEYLDQKTTEYNPENVYFGNIRDIFSNPDGSVSINRNTFDLKRMRPSEQFKIETSFDPNLLQQRDQYLLATITANRPVKPLNSENLVITKSKEL